MAGIAGFLIEARVLYAVAHISTILRLFVRWKQGGGFRAWGSGEYFAIAASVCYTGMMAPLNMAGEEMQGYDAFAASFTESQREELSPKMIPILTRGAIGVFAVFYLYIFTIWCLKGALIGLYLRLTQNTRWNCYIKWVAAWTLIGFVPAVLTQTLHCRPIRKKWQIVPDPGDVCTSGKIPNIVATVFNCGTDILLLIVPFFLVRELRISLFNKCKVFALLCIGALVVVMSLLRCIETLTNPYSVWPARECFVATLAINAPVLNALFQRSTWTRTRKDAREGTHGYATYELSGGSDGTARLGGSGEKALGKTQASETTVSGKRSGESAWELVGTGRKREGPEPLLPEEWDEAAWRERQLRRAKLEVDGVWLERGVWPEPPRVLARPQRRDSWGEPPAWHGGRPV